MFPVARPHWALVLVTVASLPAFGQTVSGGPAASSVSQVELTYRSTLDTYQRFNDEKVGSWRDANDTVGRIGGWRTYAKEGREPSGQSVPPPSGAASPATPPPARNPHEGHGKQ